MTDRTGYGLWPKPYYHAEIKTELLGPIRPSAIYDEN